MIKVEVQDGEPLSAPDAFEFLLKLLAKHLAIRQTGQRVNVCRLRNSVLGALFFGDVLVGGNPSAAFHRFVYNRNDAPIVQPRYLAEDLPLANRVRNLGEILLDIIGTKAADLRLGVRRFPEVCSQA